MIHLDTNFLIQALIPNSVCAVQLDGWLAANEEIGISAVAWCEFVCGPLDLYNLTISRRMLPRTESFTTKDAEKAAELFNRTGRRSRSLADCQIAAVALRCGAKIATINKTDFAHFEAYGLELV